MNNEEIELWNKGITVDKYVKTTQHYLCAAVELECKRGNITDIQQAYNMVVKNLRYISKRNTQYIQIRAITDDDDTARYIILKCFFNQKKNIPAYITYWLWFAYREEFGSITEYKIKHYDTYNTLQRMYIDEYRRLKAVEKADLRGNRIRKKRERRKICELYYGGEYSELFKLRNKSLNDLFNDADRDNAELILIELFGKQLEEIGTISDDRAAAYLLGRIQGRADALKSINEENPRLRQLPEI